MLFYQFLTNFWFSFVPQVWFSNRRARLRKQTPGACMQPPLPSFGSGNSVSPPSTMLSASPLAVAVSSSSAGAVGGLNGISTYSQPHYIDSVEFSAPSLGQRKFTILTYFRPSLFSSSPPLFFSIRQQRVEPHEDESPRGRAAKQQRWQQFHVITQSTADQQLLLSPTGTAWFDESINRPLPVIFGGCRCGRCRPPVCSIGHWISSSSSNLLLLLLQDGRCFQCLQWSADVESSPSRKWWWQWQRRQLYFVRRSPRFSVRFQWKQLHAERADRRLFRPSPPSPPPSPLSPLLFLLLLPSPLLSPPSPPPPVIHFLVIVGQLFTLCQRQSAKSKSGRCCGSRSRRRCLAAQHVLLYVLCERRLLLSARHCRRRLLYLMIYLMIVIAAFFLHHGFLYKIFLMCPLYIPVLSPPSS